MKITTTVEIPPRRIADLMVTAIEGGIGYWCKSVKLLDQPEHCLKKPWYDDESIYQVIDTNGDILPLLRIAVVESDHDDSPDRHFFGLKEMEKAFHLMQQYGTPRGFHWRNLISGDDDATTADVWFQLAVFGEVVYG